MKVLRIHKSVSLIVVKMLVQADWKFQYFRSQSTYNFLGIQTKSSHQNHPKVITPKELTHLKHLKKTLWIQIYNR